RRCRTRWRGWLRIVEGAHERIQPPPAAARRGRGAERHRRGLAGGPDPRLRARAGAAAVVAAVDRARAGHGLPREPDASGDVPESVLTPLGWRDGEHPVLG